MKNFWTKLKRPFFALAPMDEVTDMVFRRIVAKASAPDIFFTEFTNVDGLQSPGRKKLIQRLKFDKSELPIVAQIWGLNPQNYRKTAQELKEMGFDGIDINMGCPVRTVVKNGACSALIDNPQLAKEIIEATIEGSDGLPVSVKTRLGTKQLQTEEWIGFLLNFPLAAITIHGRTAREQSLVPPHWDEIAKAVKLRDERKSPTLIIGNGDITSYQEGLDKVRDYGIDGVMIGRGIFKNLWIFNQAGKEGTAQERFEMLEKHAHLFAETYGTTKKFDILKKFCKAYINNFEGAVGMRIELMECQNYEQLYAKINEQKQSF